MSRPYFEMKVVKVKGKKKEYCPRCGSEIIMEKPVGNWVNGENLDKIKFPCFCIFDSNKGINGCASGQAVKGVGIINKTWEEGKDQYQLSWGDHQEKGLSVLCTTPSFKRLMEIYVCKIVPAKIIIFEEEE